MRARRPASKHRAGLTLVEAAALIAVVGALLAVFVPTFFAHLRTSKTAEAAEQLSVLHDRTAAYFAAVHSLSNGTLGRRCLPEAAGPTPAKPAREPREIDFSASKTPGHPTWEALGFQPEEAVRYRYTFAPEEAGCGISAEDGEPVLVLRAEGDLDSDGTLSRFERIATVSQDGELIPTGVLYVHDRME